MPVTRDTLRLVEQVRAIVDRLTDGTTRDLTAAWVRAWDTLAPEIVDALVELLAIGGDRWPTRAQILRSGRAKAVLVRAREALDRLADQARTGITSAAALGAEVGAAGVAALIASQLPVAVAAAAALGFGKVSAEAIATIAERAGKRIGKLLRPLPKRTVKAIERQLIRGGQDSDPRETARRVLRRAEEQFNASLSDALVIARTETIDAHREAAKAAQDADPEVLDGWVWLARLGPNTCPACFAMHGTVHPLSEPGPMGHPACKCSRAPKTKTWRELGIDIDIDEPEDLIADAQATFRAMPRSRQLQVMGRARLDLLDRGAIAWKDLARLRANPGWRHSYEPTPVRDLQPA